ncbi:MAG: 50S ribosomal protein L25/general stress protein Ctc [Microbacteriaceae bacterium]
MAKQDNKVEALVRDNFGKGAARKLRAVGRIPAVLYGHGTEPAHMSLPAHEMSLILRQANALIEIVVDGKDVLGLVKDVQKDPVRQIIEHIDLLLVKKGEKVHVEIPIIVEGEAAPGTMVNHDLNTLRVEAEATHIPQSVTVSVEGLEEGAHILAKDIALPKGATLIDEPELLVLNITAATVAATETVEAEEAAPAAESEAAAE